MRKTLFIAAVATLTACSMRIRKTVDYRGEMRALVGALSAYAKGKRPGFLIVVQNGIELVSPEYLAAIDGIGQESLHYSHAVKGRATSAEHRDYLYARLGQVKSAGKRVWVTDYVATEAQAEESDRLNRAAGFDGFAATRRELDEIPRETGPFLYLINPAKFPDKEAFLAALGRTRQELLIVDAGFAGRDVLTKEDVARLKKGGRTVIAYLSVGEAETYRDYWNPAWERTPPSWLAEENPDWKGNIKVRYWNPAWRRILFGTPKSALDRILAADFDGVYLDIVDAFAYFEAESRPKP